MSGLRNPDSPTSALSVGTASPLASGSAVDLCGPSKLIRLLDSSAYYPIFSGIVNELTFDDVARLSFACRALATLPREVVNLECNVDKMLRRWFRDPRHTRTVMARQNAIIGSHFATSLFSRQFDTAVVRFYVTQGPQSEALEAYFKAEGYQECVRPEASPESRRRKFAKPDTPWYLVEMRLCSTSPIGAFLAAVNTTHLLNLVTSHKAYCMFPKSSFIHKMSFITRDITNESVQHAIARYSILGYDFQPVIWNSSPLPYTREITSPRRFGDKFTWAIEFDNVGIPDPVHPLSVVESTCFRLSVTPDPMTFGDGQQNYAASRYRLSCSSFRSCVLKHVYTFGCSQWRAYIGARVDALTKIEMCKIPGKDLSKMDLTRKRDFYTLEGNFEKPAQWRCYDHLIRGWWEEWVKENNTAKKTSH
ncbi:hypothetical protein Dda_3482 [Drechslerella dactyloides]|uniref:Uncharacterized protein n=1 Tax=Drechslerella dactyloides TaxID=74499 RepID=A0AAD6J1M1_DREDA|nr:hypothetical protein Dda_3482 [Drechslerella dactyloides]